MPRLRQQHPSNYGYSGNISDEFENLVRYINSGELGNKTIPELLRQIFDPDGYWAGPIEIRIDAQHGLQYRVGQYSAYGVPDGEAAWVTIVPMESLRGIPGSSLATVSPPILRNRADYLAAEGQVFVPVEINAGSDAILYVNGALKTEAVDYTVVDTGSPTGLVLSEPLVQNDKITVYRVLPDVSGDYRRQDYEIASTTGSLIFEFEPEDAIAVYRNGFLMSEGATKDYIGDPINDLIVFNSPLYAGERVSVLSLLDQSRTMAAGLMLEGNYSDPETGMIWGSKVRFEDGQIPQSKVYGLAQAMSIMASYTEGPTPPITPTLFWLDTSRNPQRMMFWDGVRYIPTAGQLDIPTFGEEDKLKVMQVDGTGTVIRWGNVDLSGLIKSSQKGAAFGVATLDEEGRLVAGQLPSPRERRTIWTLRPGTTANGDILLHRFFMSNVRIIGFLARLDTGTATAQLKINGVASGPEFSLGVSPNETALGAPIAINALSASVSVAVAISSVAAATNLDVGIVVETVDQSG
jgi:hypothetical protein